MENRICQVELNGYEGDLGKLIRRRLGRKLGLEEEPARVRAHIGNEADFAAWCEAIAAVLSRDLSCLELAEIVGSLNVSPVEKRAILTESIHLMRTAEGPDISTDVRNFFSANESMNLEGYMRFRMQDARQHWELCVLHAAEESMLRVEYAELLRLLAAFVNLRPPRVREIWVILNPDGSCTLTDDMDSRVRFDDAHSEGIMSALVGLAPARITIYDLSGGKGGTFANTLAQVFQDRVRYFK